MLQSRKAQNLRFLHPVKNGTIDIEAASKTLVLHLPPQLRDDQVVIQEVEVAFALVVRSALVLDAVWPSSPATGGVLSAMVAKINQDLQSNDVAWDLENPITLLAK